MPGCKGVTDSFLCLHSRAGWKEPQLEAGQGDEKAPPKAAHDSAPASHNSPQSTTARATA